MGVDATASRAIGACGRASACRGHGVSVTVRFKDLGERRGSTAVSVSQARAAARQGNGQDAQEQPGLGLGAARGLSGICHRDSLLSSPGVYMCNGAGNSRARHPLQLKTVTKTIVEAPWRRRGSYAEALIHPVLASWARSFPAEQVASQYECCRVSAVARGRRPASGSRATRGGWPRPGIQTLCCFEGSLRAMTKPLRWAVIPFFAWVSMSIDLPGSRYNERKASPTCERCFLNREV